MATFFEIKVCVDEGCGIEGWHQAHDGLRYKSAPELKNKMEEDLRKFMAWVKEILPPRFFKEDGSGRF